MDDPVDSLAELEANLRDIALANRFLGGISPVARIIERVGAKSVLDVGCGAADVPRAILTSARRRGHDLEITCLDRSEQMLAIASRDAGGMSFLRGDATALPFADASFDVATCCLALHHFVREDAIRALRELRRVSRLTAVVCDLRRSALAYAGARALSLFTSNRLTRHDAPISVLRAYTPQEALTLARAAGWQHARARTEPWFRMILTDESAAVRGR